MAGTSVLKLKVDDKEYNASLRQAQQGMQHLEQALQAAGKTFNQVDKSVVEYARGIGKMEAQSKTARGRVGEMTSAFVELSTQYNKMSADVQKSDLGQALSKSIDQLRQRTIAAKQELEDLNRQLSNTKAPDIGAASGGFLSGIGDKMGGALQVFAGNMLTKAAGMVANLGTEMAGLVQQGVELARQGEGIRNAFERLGRGDILDGLRQATHGTVTDIELMKAAVKFNDFKLPLDELGTMLAFAQQKAKDTGQSVDYMVDSIVTGLGRKSLMILDNLGLSATEVKERMAETGDMTKAVGDIIREQMAKAGDYVETAADRAAQANVSLQNKMEELGRKFAPVEEASSQLWTSMKISILDVVGGPLARLLNGLTEAGRLKNMLDDLNGGGNGKESQTEKALRILREYSGGGRGIEGKRDLYNRQVASFSSHEEKAWREANRLREELKGLRSQQKENGLAGNLQPLINETSRQLEAAENRAKTIQIMRSTYQKGAASILNPVTATNTNTPVTIPTRTSGATAATPKTEEQQNAARIAELVKQYQDLATAAKTADDVQKAGLTERMTKIQGEIKTLEDRNTELKKFADEARQVQFPVGSLPQLNEQLKTLQTEQEKALDAKQWQDYQQQIEQAQYQIDALKGKWHDGLQATFKLNIEQQGTTDINTDKPDDIAVTFKADDSDILAKLRDIEGVNIDPKTLTVTANTAKAYDQVQELLKSVDGKTVTFAVQPKMETGTSITNNAGIQVYIASIKQQLETADYGTSLYNGLSAQLADMTTLQNLVGASLKAGLSTAMFDVADETGKDFWTRAMEGGVENIDWQAIVDKINEARKAAGLDAIRLDFTTGTVSNDDKTDKNENPYLHKNKDGKQEVRLNEVLGGVAHGMQGMASGLEQLGVDIPSGIQDVLNGVNGVVQILTSIMSVITAIEAISAADALVPYANGGVVRAEAGWSGVVPGNSMSGDNVPALLNSGEVVLNHAQVAAVANELQGKEGGAGFRPSFITGEQIHIVHNRYLRRVGEGELVTWKNT